MKGKFVSICREQTQKHSATKSGEISWGPGLHTVQTLSGSVIGRVVILCLIAMLPTQLSSARSLIHTRSPRLLRPCLQQIPRNRFLATVADTRETGFKIPIIDFETFLKGGVAEKQKAADEILEGFTSSGFIYLGNTNLPKGTVSDVFSCSKKFFDLPSEEKRKLAWETPESNRGYVAPGREKVSRLQSQEEIEKIRAAAPDLKESMEIGKEPSDNYQVY